MKGRWAATALWLLIPALQAIHADGPSPAVDPAAPPPEGAAADRVAQRFSAAMQPSMKTSSA